jgi:hypothetical protein
MLLVNGYVCTNCADEAKAKRGIDPSKTAVELQQEESRRAASNRLGVNVPRSDGVTGARLNLYA